MSFSLYYAPDKVICGQTFTFVVDHEYFGCKVKAKLSIPLVSYSYEINVTESNPGSLNKIYEMTVPMAFEKEVLTYNSYGKKGNLIISISKDGQSIVAVGKKITISADPNLYQSSIGNVKISKEKLFDGKLIKGHSTVSFSAVPDITNTNGARISRVIFHVKNTDYPGSGSLLSSTYTSKAETFAQIGTYTGYAKVIDTRGGTAVAPIESFTVHDYSLPKITSMLVQRCLENGNIDDDGLFISMTANYTFHSVSGANSIVKTEIYTKARSESTYTLACTSFQNNTPVIFGGAYETKKGYDVKVVITDKVGSQALSVDYITTGSVGLELYRNQAAAFGKPVEQTDGLELAEKWNFYAHEDVYIDNDLVLGGNAYIGGKVIEMNPDVYKIPTGKKGIVEITGMVSGDFVMIDFLLFTVATGSMIETHKLLVYYSGTRAYINFYKPTTDFYEHIFATSKTGGAQVDLWRVTTSASIQAFYKVNSVITNSKGAVINFQGTRL